MDYLQNSQNQSYLGVDSRVRGCYVGLTRLAEHAPKSPSNSPPLVRVRKPLKYARISDEEEDEEPEDISSGDDSVGDPTVDGDKLSDSGEEELLAPRLPVTLKVLEYLEASTPVIGLSVYLSVSRSSAVPGSPPGRHLLLMVVPHTLTWVMVLLPLRY